MKKRCAITGASGYVGSRIAQVLASEFDIVPLGRNANSNAIRWTLGETGISSELERRGVEVLVHCAWDMRESSRSKNWQTNVAGSRTLIAEAVAAGVKQIIFISTISSFDQARSEYGKSKFVVEETILAAGGTVIRPGLVWGDRAGGMFEALRRQVSKGGLVPMIGHGRYPQFLVHENDLAQLVMNAAQGQIADRLILAANSQPWLLRDLLISLAKAEGQEIRLLEIPWRVIYTGLACAEMLGIRLGFRSDSVISLVHQNRDVPFLKDSSFRSYPGAPKSWQPLRLQKRGVKT